MPSLAELKNRLEAARVERERRERETREQEERELQRLVEEERREEEECARREQQRADEEEKRVEQERVAEEVRERVEEQVAEEQRNATDVGGEGLMETEGTVGVTETAGESWEADIARLHTAAMAGSSKDGGVEYQATEDTCWNCRHRKLVCERPG